MAIGSGGQRRLSVAALLTLAGCYVTAPIKPSELVHLDGYRDGEPAGGTVSVLSPDNKPIEVAGDSQIFLDLPGGTYGGTFKSIAVKDGIFNGVDVAGHAYQVPLDSVKAARVQEPNRAARDPSSPPPPGWPSSGWSPWSC